MSPTQHLAAAMDLIRVAVAVAGSGLAWVSSARSVMVVDAPAARAAGGRSGGVSPIRRP
jgi:hypothetical protein